MQWRYRNTVLALATLAFAATMLARLVVSPVLPDIVDAFAVSTGAVGLALTGMWAAYALSQYPGGLLADRYGERRVVLVGVATVALASALVALSPRFPAFVLAVVLLGAAAGFPYSAATSLLAKEFDDVGRAVGVFAAGGPAAGLLAPVAAAATAALFGWRAALSLGAAVALPVAAAFALVVRPTPPGRPDGSEIPIAPGPVADILSRPGVAFTVAIAVGGAFAWQATASFLPTFLVEHRGLGRRDASLLFSLYFVVHGATQPLTGWLSDRYGRDHATVVALCAAALGYVALLVAPGALLAVAAVPLVGLGMSWGAPVQTRFLDGFRTEERSTGFGLVRTVYMTVGSLGSVVVGALADVLGWAAAFGALAAITAVATVALVGNVFLRSRP